MANEPGGVRSREKGEWVEEGGELRGRGRGGGEGEGRGQVLLPARSW